MKPSRRVVCILLLSLLPTIGARAWSSAKEFPATEEELDITSVCAEAGVPASACSGVSSNDEWMPLVRTFDGVEMVLVPAGCFQMGNTVGFRGEQPVHEICFERPFWIDRTEVTVAQFARFLNGQDEPVEDYTGWLDVWGVTSPPRVQLVREDGTWTPRWKQSNRPLESVTWVGAAAYCAWRDARLPGEAEWEYAARGPDSLLYPWGDEFSAEKVVRATFDEIPDVGSKPQGASWVGALDMSSSLFEWVHSLYTAYPYDATDGREAGLDVDRTSERVMRGGSWYHPQDMHDDITATARFRALPDVAAFAYGLRCARSLDPAQTTPSGAPRAALEARPILPASECLAAGLPASACTGVSSNEEWTPVIRDFDGTPMVLVPAGCFTMGSTEPQIDYAQTLLDRRGLYADEQPAHRQCFREPFWIDLYEVTNGRYGSAGWWHGVDQPRESVPWYEADAYCRSLGGRLPTEVEWEYAARGPDNLVYPWGNAFDGTRLNFCDVHCLNPGADPSSNDGYQTTAPVGSYPAGASWVGALDMSGNVWEWVSTVLFDYPYDPLDGREVSAEQDITTFREVRGGGRLDPSYVVRSANRNQRVPTQSTALYGFRCARSFDPLDTGGAVETGTGDLGTSPGGEP